MADSELDVIEKALKEIRERYQRLEGRVRDLEQGVVRPTFDAPGYPSSLPPERP